MSCWRFCRGDGGDEGRGRQAGGGFAAGFGVWGLVGFGVSDAGRGGVGLDIGCSQGRRRRRKAEGGVSLADAGLCSCSFSKPWVVSGFSF